MRLNLGNVRWTALRLVVLCEHLGSLSAAAPVAHLSVAAASTQLSNLERLLGTRLFVRERRGLRPTPAGRRVASHCRLLLRGLDELAVAAARDPAPIRLARGQHRHEEASHEI